MRFFLIFALLNGQRSQPFCSCSLGTAYFGQLRSWFIRTLQPTPFAIATEVSREIIEYAAIKECLSALIVA
jgi:hypothetical protein